MPKSSSFKRTYERSGIEYRVASLFTRYIIYSAKNSRYLGQRKKSKLSVSSDEGLFLVRLSKGH